MIKKTAAKKSPGRPKKPVEEKLEQFSIRLPPRMKLGLELLAIDSKFSLSQAVEWALSNVLRSHQLSSGQTVEEILRDIPIDATGPHLALRLHKVNPQLLGLNDRRTAQMVWESADMQAASQVADDTQRRWKEYEVIDWSAKNWKTLTEISRENWATMKGINLRQALDDFIAKHTPDQMMGLSQRRKRVAGMF